MKTVEAAGGMLRGTISFLEGARLIQQLREDARVSDQDQDFASFQGIVSATDALPIGAKDRRHWATHALEKLQRDIDRAELLARELGEPACRKLIERFRERSTRTL